MAKSIGGENFRDISAQPAGIDHGAEGTVPSEAVIKGPADYIGGFVFELIRLERAARRQEMPAFQVESPLVIDPTQDQRGPSFIL